MPYRPVNCTPTERHKENSRLAKRGQKPPAAPRKIDRWPAVRLEETPEGWIVVFIASNHTLPATDVEVSLWLQLLARTS